MKFLKENKRFSFKLDGINVWDTKYTCNVTEKENELITEYMFEGGLKVTNIAKKYDKYDAWEWVNYFENTSTEPTGIISELWDCDCSFFMEHEEEFRELSYASDIALATKIYSSGGSTWSSDEFYCDVDALKNRQHENHIHVGETKTYKTSNGRSCEAKAPFFNIHKNGKGYVVAIGWTGQWMSEIARESDSIIVKSKIEDTNFRIMPGESFRTSSAVIMAYESDFVDSCNKWRRLLKENYSLVGTEGRDKYGPLCASVWGGMKSELVLERVESMKKNNLPYDYVWMDAGWYGIDTGDTPDEFEGDWSMHTGDWRVSKVIHPGGLKDVSKSIHDGGMKFLLWFEPERVINTTPICYEHPEYFLKPVNETSKSIILDFGNDDAWNYCFDMLSETIEEIGIDCYRQDFNISPLDIWRNNDADDRQGITEIKHINGLYRLWDALLEKFPHLLIDNCAGGGRRIDIELMKRSFALWRSDYQCCANYDVEASQCHNMSFNTWILHSGTGTGRIYDEYRVRSAYGASLNFGYSFSAREGFCDTPEKTEFLKKYTEEYLRIRPYFYEDFYPLTSFSDKLDTWCASQYNRPGENDGMVQIFRREKSPYETAVFKLRGLKENAIYKITNLDGGEFEIDGKTLMDEGLKITVPEKRKALIYIYKGR